MTDVFEPDRIYLEDQMVYQYLLEHPAFFQQHPELLSRLRLPHAQRGAVSLVERQMEMQRERVRGLEEDITRLMSIARQNEHIFFALNQLHLDIASAQQKTDIRLALSAFANKMPQVHACTLLEFSNESMGEHFSGLTTDAGKSDARSTSVFWPIEQRGNGNPISHPASIPLRCYLLAKSKNH